MVSSIDLKRPKKIVALSSESAKITLSSEVSVYLRVIFTRKY